MLYHTNSPYYQYFLTANKKQRQRDEKATNENEKAAKNEKTTENK